MGRTLARRGESSRRGKISSSSQPLPDGTANDYAELRTVFRPNGIRSKCAGPAEIHGRKKGQVGTPILSHRRHGVCQKPRKSETMTPPPSAGSKAAALRKRNPPR